MDLQLPELDGFMTTRILKQDVTTKDIPVVALTAYAMKGDADKALEAGCDGYITKPIDTRVFPPAGRKLCETPGETVRIRRKSRLKPAGFEALARTSHAIASSLDPQRVGETVVQIVGGLMEGTVVQAWSFREEDGVLIPLGTYGLPADHEKSARIPVRQGVVGRVAASRRPIALEDIRGDPHALTGDLVKQKGLISFLGVPLVREEKLFGVLAILTRTPYRFRQSEIRLFASFAQQAAIALENAYRYQDLQRSYQELLATQEELVRKARMATIGEIARAVSHETHNFLGALSTCVQLLRSNPHIAGRDAELLDIIESGTQWFTEIVSQISTLGCSAPPRFEELDLHELIDETLAILQRDARCPAAVVVHQQAAPSPQKVRGDRDQLRQVFQSLFLNAVQAMREEGELHVETQRMENQVKILVRDTGPGIATTVLPNIFEPFYSTKSGHLGLGLAIVRRVVEEHEGQITVDSAPEKGACFVVELPLEPRRH